MKEFYITSTITIEAESKEKADELLRREQKNENNQSQWAYDLLTNAQIDEA